MLLSNHKPSLSVASVPPYGRTVSKPTQSAILSPRPLKKNFNTEIPTEVMPPQPPSAQPQHQSFYGNPNMYSANPMRNYNPARFASPHPANHHMHAPRAPPPDIPVVSNAQMINNGPMMHPEQMRMRSSLVNHCLNPRMPLNSPAPRVPTPRIPSNIHMHTTAIRNVPPQGNLPSQNVHNQHLMPANHAMMSQNASVNQTAMQAPFSADHAAIPYYCADCVTPPTHMKPPPMNSTIQPQMIIKPERQRIEDEILLRQRELDSCWQEDELDCPRDFTALDRKKEKCYAQLNTDLLASPQWHQGEEKKLNDAIRKEGIHNREIKTNAVSTSAMLTTLPREHELAPTVSNPPTVKMKAKAVVSPLPRQVTQKRVNINTVVSQFSYNEQQEMPQDFSNPAWPQSEIGSRIPSSERINLSPLCMSAAPSGMQTPVEPGVGQRPLDIIHSANSSVTGPSSENSHMQRKIIENDNRSQNSNTSRHNSIDSEKKKIILMDKFRGNEQYKPPLNVPIHPAPDSIKNYTFSQWPQSEMGSRIPSSERISLSPLTMSGNPSGIQTPAEPNTGAFPLSSVEGPIADANRNWKSGPLKDRNTPLNFRVDSPISSRADSHVSGRSDVKSPPISSDVMKDGKNQVELPPDAIVADNTQDFSQFPQSELTSRVPSSERICLSPICQSAAPSGRQSPAYAEEDAPPDNNYTVKLRPKKKSISSNADTEKLDELMVKMNLGTGPPGVPRFHFEEEDQIKNYGQPEASTRIQSYENLSYAGPWSTNTSGLVTPCDHSSLYGDGKTLRYASGSIAGSDIQDNIPAVSVTSDVNPDHQTKRSQSVDHSVDGVSPVDERDHSDSGLSRNELQRQNSWSSVGSSCSNRTDMSTVVNAPTSMHNTAPGSPDPDGSEVSDSEVSEPENIDANSELPASFSQPLSPSLSTEGNLHIKSNQVQPRRPILRNRNLNAENMHKNSPQASYPQDNLLEKPNNNPPVNPIQDFIQMAKEQFANNKTTLGSNDEKSTNAYPAGRGHPPQASNNINDLPNQQYKMYADEHHERIPQLQQRPYQELQQRPHQEPPPHQHAPDHSFNMGGAGVFTEEHHMNMYHRGFVGGAPSFHQRYMPRPSQSFYMHSYNQTQYPISEHVPPGPAFNQFDYPKHRMQSIPEGRAAQTLLHNGVYESFPKQILREQPPFHDGVPPMMHGNSRPPLNQQEFYPHGFPVENNAQQSGYHDIPLPPRHIAHITNQENLKPNPQQQQQARAYSITSLEPNRDSPPRSESLDTESVMSFASMAASNQNLDTKADMMMSLLTMLGTHDSDDMARTLLAMSSSPDSCAAMRQSGCLPLIIQLIHDNQDEEINWGARQRAGMALHNIVHSNSTDRRGKREIRVLRLLEIIRTHSEAILSQRDDGYRSNRVSAPLKEHGPGPAVAAIMKLSFEEEHKNTICELGGLQTIGEILAVDFIENNACQDPYSIALRKYAGMVMINLTYNDSKNKAILCSMPSTLRAVTGQLRLTDAEDLVQVYAGIIRNISWRPDDKTQKALQKVNAIRALLLSIQNLKTEVCIRTVLSAVWNLSAHNSQNKEEVCRTPGSLKYLAHALKYRSPSNSFDVVENAGGILRNVSSHIAVNMNYRRILRQEGCLQTLVAQLRSQSTHVISNSCGVLWNLSARCAEDQQLLWDLGAVSILKTLIHVKHKSISAGAAAALRNLLAVTPGSGTDTESNLSLQRSNSVPPGDRIRRIDKHYKSMGANDRRRKVKGNNAHDERMNYTSTEEEPPPTYHDVFGPTLREMHHRQPSNSSQVFFPADGPSKLLPMHNRLHNRFNSTSSCSSFSPMHDGHPAPNAVKLDRGINYCESLSPSLQMMRNEEVVMLHRRHENINTRNFPLESSPGMGFVETSSPNETRDMLQNEEIENNFERDPYGDSPLSRIKDAVLIYTGTPAPAKKPTKKEKRKIMTPKLLLKSQKNKKSSESILSSRDSLLTDTEKGEGSKNDGNIWIKTKQRMLNKSHSSDLAFDKNLNQGSSKKTPFELYSMSAFPNRVASDQCLSVTERNMRDHLNGDRENPHGSWSSFNVNHIAERLDNQQGGNYTPNLSSRRDGMPSNENTGGDYPYNFPENVFNQQQKQISIQMNSLPYLNTHINGEINHHPHSNAENIETENKKTGKFRRISLLRNPLKKSESKSKKHQSEKQKAKDKK